MSGRRAPALTPAASTALVVARRVAIVLLFVMVLTQPGLGRATLPSQGSDLDVLVVVDRTRSMAALDHFVAQPSGEETREPRIAGATTDLEALAAALPGSRFGMLAFGTDPRLVLPFTSDTAAFTAALDTLYLEGPRDGTGSRADRAAPEVTEVLQRAADRSPERRRIVVYVGDGENTASGQVTDQSFTAAGDLSAGGAVLGYGTAEGGPMPESDDFDTTLGYVRDPETGETAISRIDPGTLERIADELGVPYAEDPSTDDLTEIAASFEASYSSGGDDQPAEHDLTWLAALALLALLLVELHAGWRAVWGTRRTLVGAAAPTNDDGGGR